MVSDIIYLLLGLVLIIAGGNYLTNGAVGSSTPDLVVALTSTIEGHSVLATGDVVGANIFDILLAVGIMALISPMISPVQVGAINVVDFSTMILGALLLFIFGTLSRSHTLPRWLGVLLCLLYITYMFYVVTVPA